MKKRRVNDELLKAEARKISVREGSMTGIMEGFGSRYVAPYALAMKATSQHIGWLSSLPSLLGSIAQLFTLRLMKHTSRKKIVLTGVFLQAFMWLPLIGIGLLYFNSKINSNVAAYLLIAIYSMMVLAGAVAGPAWNSWMKDIVPDHVGSYFGRRSKITGLVALASMLVAGYALDILQERHVFFAFAILFFVAMLGRTLSGILFTKKYEPKYEYDPKAYFSFAQFVKKMPFTNFGKFVIFVSIMSFAVAIASPFFTVYMLKDLNLSIFTYTLIVFVNSLVMLLFMPTWGKFADSHGNVKVFRLTSGLIAAVPLLWMVSAFIFPAGTKLVIYLLIVEIFSGFVWAGFNLSVGNFIYEAVKNSKIAFCTTYFNILSSFAAFFGALIGGYLASLNNGLFGLTPILFVFLVSTIARFVVTISLSRSFNEVKLVKEFDLRKEVVMEFKRAKISDILNYLGIRHIRIT